MLFLENVKLFLEKTIKTSTIRRNKNKKRNAYAGRAAINMARDKNPAMYRKYKRERERYLKMKEMMKKRYGNKAKAVARKTMR
jgi:hypothetical protein